MSSCLYVKTFDGYKEISKNIDKRDKHGFFFELGFDLEYKGLKGPTLLLVEKYGPPYSIGFQYQQTSKEIYKRLIVNKFVILNDKGEIIYNLLNETNGKRLELEFNDLDGRFCNYKIDNKFNFNDPKIKFIVDISLKDSSDSIYNRKYYYEFKRKKMRYPSMSM